jgi:hypothetical protein
VFKEVRKAGARGVLVAGADVVEDVDGGHGAGRIFVHEHGQSIVEDAFLELDHAKRMLQCIAALFWQSWGSTAGP